MPDEVETLNASADKVQASIEARAAGLRVAAADGKRILPLVWDWTTLQEEASHLSWVVKRVLPANSIGVMFGASGTFKSFVAIDASMHIAHGLTWLGQKTAAGDVVYLAAEGGVGILRRVKAWHQQRDRRPEDGKFWFVTRPLELLRHANDLRKAVEELKVKPALIVIDTMSQTFTGEENSSNEVAEFLRAIRAELVVPFGCCVLLIHHSGHSVTERPRGSSAIRANTDFLFAVHRDAEDMACTLENTHQKDGELFRDATFDLQVVQIGVDEDGDAIKSLVARELGSVEEYVEKVQSEFRAGRGDNNKILHGLCQFDGQSEEDLRDAFYKSLGKDKTSEAKKKAFQRSRSWLVNARLVDFVAGKVVQGPKWTAL